MVEVEFRIKNERITRAYVGDFEFLVNAPKEATTRIEKLFKELSKEGVIFTKIEEVEERGIEKELREFIKNLTEKQKCILRQFKDREEVKKDELQNKCGDLRGPLAGLTKKAQSKGLIEPNETALELDTENRIYRVNPKLKRVVDLL